MKRFLFSGIIVLFICSMGLGYWNRINETVSDNSPLPEAEAEFSIGISKDPVAWLALLAAENGMFEEQGLKATIKYYPSGKRALQAMLRGDVGFAASAGSPISIAAFQGKDFLVLSTLGSGDDAVKIVARRDHGIKSPEDLKGKTITTQQASAVHFFLDLFLLKHGLTGEVKQTFMKKEELPKALVRGDIGAISTREPFLTEVVKQLGDNAVVFSSPGLFRKSSHLVVQKEIGASHPRQVKAVLRAIISASQLLQSNPDDAFQVISKATGVSVVDIKFEMRRIDLRPRLNQSMLTSLEDSANWAIEIGIVKDSEIPNYLEYVHPQPLSELMPESVSLTY